ncbi:MAG: hypothetical protein UT67_C0016G0001, partial [Candidatus Magasanikbacteria bacterium GW2011_GWA2_40_10]
MSKESKKEIISNSEERKDLLSKERVELTVLNNEVEVLRGEGLSVEDLIKSIESVFKDVDLAERAIRDDAKLKKALNKILK